MGFLGSATIFKSENYVKGINTAANLWISAAVSMAIGADMWEFTFLTTIFSVIVLIVNHFYKKCYYLFESVWPCLCGLNLDCIESSRV